MTVRSNDPMHNLSIRRTSDLLPSARQAVEALLGRKLADDEEVGIRASGPHEAPVGVARKEAWERLTGHLEFMASKAATAPVDDLERLADEVADEVRHGRGAGKGRHAAALNPGDCRPSAAPKIEGRPLLFKGSDFEKTDVGKASW